MVELSSQRLNAIAVAKDVLSRLDQHKLNVRNGWYLGSFTEKVEQIRSERTTAPVEVVVDDLEEGCLVCALGACFLSKARLLGNAGSVGQLFSPWRNAEIRRIDLVMRALMTDVFSDDQLFMIETAFEEYVNRGFVCSSFSWKQRKQLSDAARFRPSITDPEERLRIIMENIIENDGEFVPCPETITTEEPSNV